MTFNTWWQEYCTKHHMSPSSPYTKAMEAVAKETWDVACRNTQEPSCCASTSFDSVGH